MQGALADSKLQPIVLINPYVEFRLPTFQGHLRFRGEIRNALNTDYQFILHFPLPGRSFVFLVGYAL
jgi:outer membrane cobalamin receptor